MTSSPSFFFPNFLNVCSAFQLQPSFLFKSYWITEAQLSSNMLFQRFSDIYTRQNICNWIWIVFMWTRIVLSKLKTFATCWNHVIFVKVLPLKSKVSQLLHCNRPFISNIGKIMILYVDISFTLFYSWLHTTVELINNSKSCRF